MTVDPVLGSFVWMTSSLAFLTAGTVVVRLLDGRTALPAWTTVRRVGRQRTAR